MKNTEGHRDGRYPENPFEGMPQPEKFMLESDMIDPGDEYFDEVKDYLLDLRKATHERILSLLLNYEEEVGEKPTLRNLSEPGWALTKIERLYSTFHYCTWALQQFMHHAEEWQDKWQIVLKLLAVEYKW